MDSNEAVTSHSQWNSKLRRYLDKHDDSLNPAEVSLDHTCALGQWIYGAGASYSALPEYAKLKYDHTRFHTVAAELVAKANSGESIDAEIAPCSSSQFSTSSSAAAIAIMAINKRVSE
ncbi:MAG: CZB domain-containing protein [Candidatus Sulfotelmatobacter sp.]